MKFIDAIGLKYFYDKLKKVFATLDSSGKVTYEQLPQDVKKIKYIKKERRNLYHKRIPLVLGDINHQINGRYDDWYYSNCPVFRVTIKNKFRLFFRNLDYNSDNTYKEAQLNDLTYWDLVLKKRVNLIEKSGDALICNTSNIGSDSPYALVCPSFIDYSTNINTKFFKKEICGYHIDKYELANDVTSVYISYEDCYRAEPWNKNLKWVGNRIECILPTTIKDVYDFIFIKINTTKFYFNSVTLHEPLKKIKVKYWGTGGKRHTERYVNRHLSLNKYISIKVRTNIITATHKYYRKQPSKFHIPYKMLDNGCIQIRKLE